MRLEQHHLCAEVMPIEVSIFAAPIALARSELVLVLQSILTKTAAELFNTEGIPL